MLGAVWAWAGRAVLPLALLTAVAGTGSAAIAVSRWLQAREDAAVAAERAAVRIETLEAELAARRAAAEVLRAHRLRLEGDIAEREQLIRDLTEGEGGDAPTSDYLRGAAERLWGGN